LQREKAASQRGLGRKICRTLGVNLSVGGGGAPTSGNRFFGGPAEIWGGRKTGVEGVGSGGGGGGAYCHVSLNISILGAIFARRGGVALGTFTQ